MENNLRVCFSACSFTGWVINRALLPTTLSLSYLVTPSYITLCLNLINHYNWTSVFILWDRNSVPIYGSASGGLSEQLNSSSGRTLHRFRQMTSAASTTFAEQLAEFQSVSRGRNFPLRFEGQFNKTS